MDQQSYADYVKVPGEGGVDRERSFDAVVNVETGEGMAVPNAPKKPQTEEQKREARRALCCSIFGLLVSLPAMIGA